MPASSTTGERNPVSTLNERSQLFLRVLQHIGRLNVLPPGLTNIDCAHLIIGRRNDDRMLKYREWNPVGRLRIMHDIYFVVITYGRTRPGYS